MYTAYVAVQAEYLDLSFSPLQHITFSSTFPACHSSMPGLELTEADDTAAHQFPPENFPDRYCMRTRHHFNHVNAEHANAIIRKLQPPMPMSKWARVRDEHAVPVFFL